MAINSIAKTKKKNVWVRLFNTKPLQNPILKMDENNEGINFTAKKKW